MRLASSDSVRSSSSLGQRQRLTPHKWVVEQVEGLGGDRGRIAAAGHHALLGEVEDLERRRRQPRKQRQIDATVRAARACSAPDRRARGPLFGSSMTFRSFAGEASGRPRSSLPAAASVASRISSGVEPPRAVPPDQPVGRVDGNVGFRHVSEPRPIGPAEHDRSAPAS